MAEDAPTGKDADKKAKSTSPFRDNIEVIVFAIAMSLGLKVFALEAYQIPTGSMQPTLMGTDLVDGGRVVGGVHDRVLVDKICYLVRDPVRWEVVVFRYPLATTNNYVKRVVGMPAEELLIEHGDIWTRPLGSAQAWTIQRKPQSVQEALWKQVYPKPGTDAEVWTNWQFQRLESAGSDGTVTLQNGGVLSFPSYGSIEDTYRDGYPDAIYSKVPPSGAHGRSTVSDLRIAFTATPRDDSALVLEASCGAFNFELRLGGDASALMLPDGSQTPLDFTTRPDRPVDVAFAFWDHHWEVRLDGASFAGDLQSEARRAPANGFALRAEGAWQLQPPRIWRDVHYLPSLEGGAGLYEIPEGEYFMLGDNTQNSLDSRDWKAREFHFDPPLRGHSVLRGDSLPEGHDPRYNNPRFDRNGVMTLRDEWGDLHVLTEEDRAQRLPDRAERVTIHTVPRRYIQGKALAVFLPIPPFSPVWRIGWIH